jgi:acetoin utilization deacetylase AcuC-like enzyme
MNHSQLKVIFHESYYTDYETASCETPERVRSIVRALEAHYPIVRPDRAAEEDVLLVHTASALRDVKTDDQLYDTALFALGGVIKASEFAMEGVPAFAAVRPPGHHASPGSFWGFCFFNHVAIAIERLLRKRRITRALILDIDLHFGDGTDNHFVNRREVTVANIQENFRESFLRAVKRALASNEYDIVAVSAGFDRHVLDWGGTLTTEDYFTIGRLVRDFAEENCEGRYFAALEGGYNIDVLGENALALCRGMEKHPEIISETVD